MTKPNKINAELKEILERALAEIDNDKALAVQERLWDGIFSRSVARDKQMAGETPVEASNREC